MTPKDLIDGFEILADAPNGIGRLRELILTLAVQGKLVPQDSSDEPATILIKRIAREKNQLVDEKTARKPMLLALVELNDLPTGWAAVSFGSLFMDVMTGPFGTSLKKSDYLHGGTPVVNPQNLRGGRIVEFEETAVGPPVLERLRTFLLRERDIVVARRGEMGRCAVVEKEQDGWLCGTGSLVLRPPTDLLPDFVALFLRCPATVDRLSGESVGSTMRNLNQRIMTSLEFRLPPLAEQSRIAARVDELMALLNRLEAAQGSREATRQSLRDAALSALRDADTAEAVHSAWSRIADQMNHLFTDPGDIQPLRRAILQLAVRGRLVSQNPADESASKALERVASQRASLTKRGKLRKQKLLAPIDLGQMPFVVPEGWQWVRPDEISDIDKNALAIGPFGSNLLKSDYRDRGVPLVFVREIRAETFGDRKTKFIDPDKADELSSHSVSSGDVLITKMGAPPGDTAVYPEGRPDAVITADVVKFRLHPGVADARYVKYLYRAPVIRDCILEITMGIAHQKMSLKRFRETPIPLPPVPEQSRIVGKVQELMALCDRVESRLVCASSTSSDFAASAVASFA